MNFKTGLLSILFIAIASTTLAKVGGQMSEDLPTKEEYNEITKYQCWITLKSGRKEKGILFQVSEEEVVLLPSTIKDYDQFLKAVKTDKKIIKNQDVLKIKTRKSKRLRKSLLIGIAGGGVPGLLFIIADLIQQGDFFGLGIFLGLLVWSVGALIGLLFGTQKKSHLINSSVQFQEIKRRAIMSFKKN